MTHREDDVSASASSPLVHWPAPLPPRPPMPAHYKASFYWPEIFKEHPALGVSLTYAILTLAGAGYAGFYYYILKVNFLQLTDAADFLVIVFQHPLVPLLLLLPFPLFSGYMALSYRLIWWVRWRFPAAGAKLPDPTGPPKYGPRMQRIMGYLFFSIYAVAGLEFYALGGAMKVRNGEGQRIVLEIRPSARSESMDFASKEVLLLGTTTRFTIVYDPDERRAWSLPHDSIARILHPARQKPDAEAVEAVVPAAVEVAAPVENPPDSAESPGT